MSALRSPVFANSSAGPKCSTYCRSASSHTQKPGTTAAPALSATCANPVAVHAGIPKKLTNSPCGGVMFVSIRMPTVPPSCIAFSRPRPKSSLCRTRLPCRQRIEHAVVEPADHHPHRVAHQRVVEARQLPRAEVAGKHQHALAFRLSGKIVLEALGPQPSMRVAGGVTWEAAELDKLPAKVAVDVSQDFFPGFGRGPRKRQHEVALAYIAEAREAEVDRPGENTHQQTRCGARQPRKSASHRQYSPVLNPFPHH